MPGNKLGQTLTLTSWGESHGSSIGGVLDGIPPRFPLDELTLQKALDRRRPGQSPLVSQRQEADKIKILSGVFEGKTLGTPLSFLIENTNQHSEDYDAYRDVFRPGHADLSYQKKYGIRDHRGSGRASARETAVRVAAGTIALQILQHLLPNPVQIRGALTQIGSLPLDRSHWDWEQVDQNAFFCPDAKMVPLWTEYLTNLKEQGKSAGALIEVHATGIPAGLGEPVYDKLDADLAKALMSINAVKGVEIGDGFACASAPSGYDEIKSGETKDPIFLSNTAGGIIGGISTGQDIVCRLALKPTSSTTSPRQTITQNGKNTTLSVTGRHDPCVGIRAVPIAEAMVALVLADHLLRWRGQCGVY